MPDYSLSQQAIQWFAMAIDAVARGRPKLAADYARWGWNAVDDMQAEAAKAEAAKIADTQEAA